MVVDTAPTGHTLRLLASPDTVLAVAQVLDSLQDEHRMIRARFAASVRPEAADRLIDHLNDQARHTAALLRDAAGTSLRWVMLPERLSLAETEDALASLEAAGMRVSSIVVNRVVPPGPSCPTCDRRRIDEAWVIARLGRTVAKGRELRRVPALMREPRDVSALAAVGRALIGSRLVERGDVDQARPERPTGDARLLKSPRDNVRPRLHLESLRSARLLFFCGKGGAGKTTTASATAIALARDDAARRVLLLSIDPAHSLGDVFASRMSDAVATVDSSLPNLHVRELDAAAALEGRRAEIKEALQEIVARFGAGAVIAAGSRGVADLVDLAPPGIDELFGFVSVMQLLEANSYSVVVVDAAPTGHALRLLEMPDTARDWLHVLLRLLLKYRTLVRPGRLAAELLELSKAIRGLQRSLRDPLLARFIVVTRAARLPRLETDRLLKRLKRIGVSVPAALVNAATLTPGRCPRCRATAAAEARELAPLAVACRRAFRDCAIIQTPLVAPPPRGVKALEYWARQWMS